MDNKRLRKKYWALAFIWIAIIYSTLYFVRPICEFLKGAIPFAIVMNAMIIVVLGAFLIVIGRKLLASKSFLNYALILIALLGYGYGLVSIEYPEEKLHFIQYGFLSLLIFRALIADFPRAASYGLALLLTSFFGWVDEIIQGILPNRYYQNTDVILNMFSGALGLLLVYVHERLSKRV